MTDQEELDLINAKIREIYTIGQSYTVQGSRTINNPQLNMLLDERRVIKKRIRRKNGWKGRTQGDFQTQDRGADQDLGRG